MKELPFVSVVVPTYHDWSRLSLCINALELQTYPKGDYEVIIVNNDPEDLAPEGLNLPPNFVIVGESAPGSYAARNKGIRVGKGEIFGFTDSDCIPDPTWIENAVKLFSAKKVDRVAGNIELFFKSGHKKTWVELYESIYEFDQKRIVKVHQASVTANLFVRKELFEKVGLFDQSKMSGEDFGWNRRANSLNCSIAYGADVKIFHPARSTFSEFENKKRREFGGKKSNRSKGIKALGKNVVYLPYLFCMVVIFKTFNLLFRDNRISAIEKGKVTCMNVYLFFIYVTEFFRITTGKSRVR